jgi:hypothetical protein
MARASRASRHAHCDNRAIARNAAPDGGSMNGGQCGEAKTAKKRFSADTANQENGGRIRMSVAKASVRLAASLRLTLRVTRC